MNCSFDGWSFGLIGSVIGGIILGAGVTYNEFAIGAGVTARRSKCHGRLIFAQSILANQLWFDGKVEAGIDLRLWPGLGGSL